MSKMISMRVPEDVLERVDAEARRRRLSRTALLLNPWMGERMSREQLERPEMQAAIAKAKARASTSERADLLEQVPRCDHPKAAEVKLGYGVLCGICRKKLR